MEREIKKCDLVGRPLFGGSPGALAPSDFQSNPGTYYWNFQWSVSLLALHSSVVTWSTCIRNSLRVGEWV